MRTPPVWVQRLVGVAYGVAWSLLAAGVGFMAGLALR